MRRSANATEEGATGWSKDCSLAKHHPSTTSNCDVTPDHTIIALDRFNPTTGYVDAALADLVRKIAMIANSNRPPAALVRVCPVFVPRTAHQLKLFYHF